MTSVLIVDDYPEAGHRLVRQLRLAGITAASVTSGGAALVFLRYHAPKLVLPDIMMPEMNGLDVLQQIRADRRLDGVAVVMLTSLADPGRRERALAMGAADYWVEGQVDYSRSHLRLAPYLPELGISHPAAA